MTHTGVQSGNQTGEHAKATARRALALRFTLSAGAFAVPLSRLHHLASYAALEGLPDGYFQGWLRTGRWRVPVFDLDELLYDRKTPELFGSRVLIVPIDTAAPDDLVGLLVGGATDTVELGVDAAELDADTAELLDLEPTLQMVRLLVSETAA